MSASVSASVLAGHDESLVSPLEQEIQANVDRPTNGL
jgi:hypothetical protein